MGILDKLFGPPKPDRFAQLVIDALREAGDQRAIRYDTDEFRLEFGDGDGSMYLRNFYDEYCSVPRDQRKERLRMLVRGALSHLKEIPQDFEDAKCDIYPRIWPRVTFEKMRLRQQLEGGRPLDIPSQLLGTHLEVTLVFDLPEAVRTISQDDLDAWGVSHYEAMETAKQNLETSQFAFAGIGENLYASMTGDTYDATRLMFFDLIRKLEVKGDPIAMVPNRDTLLITGSDDDEGLAMMLEFAEKALSEPRPMTANPLRLDGDEWIDWMPANDHPLYGQFRTLELKFLHPEYEDQKAILDAIHERDGTDIFVATYTAVEKQDTGELVSYCVWSSGVDALLPQTQKVALVRGEGDDQAFAVWDRVVEVIGDLMEETDLYPARYRVKDFPSNDQLAALGKEEL